MTNKRHTVFYTGITSDLIRRIWEHKNKVVEGFTQRYNLDQVIYFEEFIDPETAIKREKQVKDYNRTKKLEIINQFNPELRDLYANLLA